MPTPNNTQDVIFDTVEHLPVEAHRRTDELEAQVQRTVARHRDTLLPRLLNREEFRVVREHLVAELVQGFEHRRAALDLAMQSRLQATREACNHVLVMGKVHLREQRIDYFSTAYQRLEGRLQGLIEAYLNEAEARFTRIDRLTIEHLRERERARQEKAAGDFLDTIERLLDEFRRITEETVELR